MAATKESGADAKLKKTAVAKPATAAKKHIAPKASAEEISSTLGVTAKDKKVVDKVLSQLGYLRAS